MHIFSSHKILSGLIKKKKKLNREFFSYEYEQDSGQFKKKRLSEFKPIITSEADVGAPMSAWWGPNYY